jgi:hypothetical protein
MTKKCAERPIESAILALLFAVVIAAIIGGLSEGVHELWNWLMPAIFKLPSIGFWQAFGLLLLSWILFGGFGWLGQDWRGRIVSRRRMAERWAQMSPQERAMFQGGLRGHYGQAKTGTEESKA